MLLNKWFGLVHDLLVPCEILIWSLCHFLGIGVEKASMMFVLRSIKMLLIEFSWEIVSLVG